MSESNCRIVTVLISETHMRIWHGYMRGTGEFGLAHASFDSASVYYARYYGTASANYGWFMYQWASELYNAGQYVESAEPYRIAGESYLAAEGPESMNAIFCFRNEAFFLSGGWRLRAQCWSVRGSNSALQFSAGSCWRSSVLVSGYGFRSCSIETEWRTLGSRLIDLWSPQVGSSA